MCDVCQGRGSHPCPVCGVQPKRITCPHCEGQGLLDCVAYKMDSEETIDVSAEFYIQLPFDEEGAAFRKDRLYRGEADRCPVCLGYREVYEDEDGELYPVR